MIFWCWHGSNIKLLTLTFRVGFVDLSAMFSWRRKGSRIPFGYLQNRFCSHGRDIFHSQTGPQNPFSGSEYLLYSQRGLLTCQWYFSGSNREAASYVAYISARWPLNRKWCFLGTGKDSKSTMVLFFRVRSNHLVVTSTRCWQGSCFSLAYPSLVNVTFTKHKQENKTMSLSTILLCGVYSPDGDVFWHIITCWLCLSR